MAAMSVIGIDFGNESCYVAVAKAGGIETIANDYSLRGTPTCVAFSQKTRVLGVAAKNQMVTNMKNTVTGFKRLLGRKFNDPHVQQELRHFPFRVEERNDGGVGVRVHYMDREHVFSPEQLTAMLFTKLKETSAAALQTQVNDCVISVPSYFTNNERKALLDAAAVSGLNVLRLMNETTATSLAYGIYKQDLPAPEEKARNVVFVDVGHTSLQVWACAFHRGKLRVLATASDANLGGRDIDYALAQHFCQDFQTRYKMDARGNSRAFLRLLQEVEKIKKQMSANSTKLPLNIECFIDEKDVTGEMQRTTMEALCGDLFQRVERCLRNCLQQSKLRSDDVHSVEIVGGSSRIPAIKGLIENVFGKSPSTTLNQDEAVARGAALQCAILSPAVRVRDFSVTDVQPYAVRLCWDADTREDGEMEVFPANHAAPFSKLLTFYRREPFCISAYYSEQIPYPEPLIGKWIINDITPTPEGESQKLKIKVRVNLHGIVTIASATLLEKKEASEGEGAAAEGAGAGAGAEPSAAEPPTDKDQEQPNGAADTEVSNPASPDKQSWTQKVAQWFSSEMTDVDKKDKGKGKKQLVKTIELPIKAQTAGLTQTELKNYFEQECQMQSADRQEKERADARNALEEYVYDVRNNIADGGPLFSFVPAALRTSFTRQLDDTVDWLYEEGEDCNRQVYSDKLNELRNQGEPIKSRHYQWECRPAALEEFTIGIQLARKVVDLCKQGDAKYSHLTEEEVKKLTDKVNTEDNWLEKTRQNLNSIPLDQDPSFTVDGIREQHKLFNSAINPIVNKPKPKEKSPPPPSNGDAGEPPASGTAPPPQPDQMDVE